MTDAMKDMTTDEKNQMGWMAQDSGLDLLGKIPSLQKSSGKIRAKDIPCQFSKGKAYDNEDQDEDEDYEENSPDTTLDFKTEIDAIKIRMPGDPRYAECTKGRPGAESPDDGSQDRRLDALAENLKSHNWSGLEDVVRPRRNWLTDEIKNLKGALEHARNPPEYID